VNTGVSNLGIGFDNPSKNPLRINGGEFGLAVPRGLQQASTTLADFERHGIPKSVFL
jgi:hypothetical protein